MYEFYRKGIMVLTPLCIGCALFLGKIVLFDFNSDAQKVEPTATPLATQSATSDDKQSEYCSEDINFSLDDTPPISKTTTSNTTTTQTVTKAPVVTATPNNNIVTKKAVTTKPSNNAWQNNNWQNNTWTVPPTTNAGGFGFNTPDPTPTPKATATPRVTTPPTQRVTPTPKATATPKATQPGADAPGGQDGGQ